MFAKGKDYFTGMPIDFEITSNEVYLAMREHINMILDAVRDVFEATPPELVSDIISEGIVLTGGTAQLFGMDKVIEDLTGVKTTVADDPVNCVVNGIGKVLEICTSLRKTDIYLSHDRISREALKRKRRITDMFEFDAMSDGIAPGGLRNKDDIKVLICYLLKSSPAECLEIRSATSCRIRE